MKIACDACEAKYSIADDKVRGKVFKIRCKKCSNVIVVRGVGEVEPEPPESPEPVAVAAPGWHLVIREEQVGPFTLDEVRARLGSGEIDRDTYAWREGQPDWVPLGEIVELAPETPETLAEVPLPAPSVVDENVQRLRGERNESSVLFSLNNLAQIATRTPPRAAAASGGLETHAPGQEGSGLIDIRSMASAYLGAGTATMKPAASIGSIDDLPVFNTGSAFSEPAVLVPTIARATPSKLMYAMIAAIVAFATVAIILLVMLLGHHEPAVVAVAAPPPAPHEVAPPPPAPPAPIVAPPPIEAPPPAAPAPAPKARKVAPPPAPPPPAPKQVKQSKQEAPSDCDDIFCVVNTDAPCCQKQHAKATPPPPPPPSKNLPDQLTVSMITTAMDAVRGKAMGCASKSTAKGRVRVHLRVGGDGHVSSVTVEASPDDALGACVKASVSRATFPQTNTGGSFSVPYTF